VLHLISTNGVPVAAQQSLLMPLLTRLPKQRIRSQVICLAPNFTTGAVLRQAGVPVHDIALSSQRLALSAPAELLNTVKLSRPQIIQAWGSTAQLIALAVRARCDWNPKVVWSMAETAPLKPNAGFFARQKLKLTARFSAKADRIVYTSEAAAAMHRRVQFTDAEPAIIPPGVDAMRFKPDFNVRHKVREQLGIATNAFVIGMVAPFQPEYDHATFLQGVGELIKTNPNVHILLAGHGVQRGNAPLMALLGGGALGTRTQLLGDWSDVSAFYNACDVACSSARVDDARMTLMMAMLCGVPCVATGMGAQGEILGQFGIAIEPGSPAAFIRGIKRVMEMPKDKRAFMVLSARKHALTRFIHPRAAQQYLQLYFELAGIQADAASELPMPQIDPSIPEAPIEVVPDAVAAGEKKMASTTIEWADPDSLEAASPEKPAEKANVLQEGDVLELFESGLASSSFGEDRNEERARGVAEEVEDLLAPEVLQAPTCTTKKNVDAA
jgi:glycosyltransferase involved in cell wall biosynthesis